MHSKANHGVVPNEESFYSQKSLTSKTEKMSKQRAEAY